MGRGDAPTAVAISLKKRRQARLDSGAFSEAGLKAFVDRLVGGKAMTTPLQVGRIHCSTAVSNFEQLGPCVCVSGVRRLSVFGMLSLGYMLLPK